MSTRLPHLTISWNKRDAEGISVLPGIFPDGKGLVIGMAGYRPAPYVVNGGERCVAVIGTPVVGEKISPEQAAQQALDADDFCEYARRLNGQFLVLILQPKLRQLAVISDRFNGVPLYWADSQERFLGAYLYHDLFPVLRRAGARLRPEVMLQFLCLNRVLFDATFDSESRFLLPANLLRLGSGQPTTERYWRPSFAKAAGRKARDSGAEYVSTLRRSLMRLTSDREQRRYGLFLSGGHDSRSVLAAFDPPPVCLTVAFSDNLEVQCARSAAAAVGATHRYIPLADDHMVRNFDDAVRLCGGMYSFLDALFIGLESQVQESADVVFHGHGLDYMFQGMYLPARWITLFGSPTFFRRLQPLDGDLATRFLNEIPFRVKGIDLPQLLRREVRERELESLTGAVRQVLADGEDICQTTYDRWEYLLIHALGRHYSHPNIDSKLTCAEQRTPCFDNDLFDFYLSLPPQQRVEGEMMRFALNTMNPALGRIPTGNWGMPAGASPAFKTAWLVGRKLLRHATGNPRFGAPTLKDRTWPERDFYLRSHQRLIEEIDDAVDGGMAEAALPMLDWETVRALRRSWKDGDIGPSSFFMALITLNRFLVLSS